MEELIKMVTAKVGISESQARGAVETVVSFLKDKMPGGIGNQVESFIGGNSGSIGKMVDSMKDKVGDFLG